MLLFLSCNQKKVETNEQTGVFYWHNSPESTGFMYRENGTQISNVEKRLFISLFDSLPTMNYCIMMSNDYPIPSEPSFERIDSMLIGDSWGYHINTIKTDQWHYDHPDILTKANGERVVLRRNKKSYLR
jgi:hypothetical protein